MNRRLTGVLATLGALTVAGAITAGAAVLPRHVPAPALRTAGLPVTAASPTLVCPGPETLLVPKGGRAVDPGGAVVVRALAAATTGPVAARIEARGAASGPAVTASRTLPSGSPAPVRGSHLDLTSATAGVRVGALALTELGPALVRAAADPAATGSPAEPATLAATQSTLARTGDLRGLTSTACTAPERETWLVGGSTTAGARLRLLLANPATTPAVVDVEVLGPQGRVRAPSAEGVVVPAGREVPVMVDALAPGLARVAVHVTATSGQVVAQLEDSLLRGLTAGGVDDVPAAAAPAKEQVVPGVSLVDGYGKGAADPTAAGSTSIRVAVPGSQDAVVQLHLINSTGTVELPQTSSVTVPAGGVADVPVAGLPSGTYTAVVEADAPVVAGAQVGRSLDAAAAGVADFGWAGAATRLSGSGYVVLPPGTRTTLSLAALKAHGRVDVTAVHADGSLGPVTPVSVPQGAGSSVPLPSGAVAIRISGIGGGPVTGAVIATVDDARGPLVSVLPVNLTAAPKSPATAVYAGP